MDNDAKSQRHNNQRGKLVLLDEHNFLKKKAKLAPKWSGPHRILKLNGPCNAELKLNINKKVVVNITRLKPYHLRERNIPEIWESDQKCAIPYDIVDQLKRNKSTKPQHLGKEENLKEQQELLVGWFTSSRPP